jgi:hypothetical protein
MTMATAIAQTHVGRADQRTRTFMRGTIFAPGGASNVLIRNISSNGARVTADDPLPTGCDIIFKRGPIFAAAHIVNSDSSGASVQFYRPLGDTELASARLPLPHRDD